MADELFNANMQYLDDLVHSDEAVPDFVAWRMWNGKTGTPGPWSKLHMLNDMQTTLCGVTVPEAYDSDCHGNGDRCKRCAAIRKAAAKNDRGSYDNPKF